MGTLFNQQPRKYHHTQDYDIDIICTEIMHIKSTYGMSHNEAIDVLRIAENRRTSNIFVANGDIKDEQLAGFGELIKEFNYYFKNMVYDNKD